MTTKRTPRYPGWRTMTASERYNAKAAHIHQTARELEGKRIAAGEVPNPNLTDAKSFEWRDRSHHMTPRGVCFEFIYISSGTVTAKVSQNENYGFTATDVDGAKQEFGSLLLAKEWIEGNLASRLAKAGK